MPLLLTSSAGWPKMDRRGIGLDGFGASGGEAKLGVALLEEGGGGKRKSLAPFPTAPSTAFLANPIVALPILSFGNFWPKLLEWRR